MPRKARIQTPEHQRIPRIRPLEAEEILKRCDGVLAEPGNLAQNLQGDGFASLLRALDDKVLQLALQPDSLGERTRARVISAVLASLSEHSSEPMTTSVDEIAHTSSIVMPCSLLELGLLDQ